MTEATVGKWFKQAGDHVIADEPLVELETDKVTVEVPAPASGVLSEIIVKAGDTVAVGAVLGAIAEGAGKAEASKIDGARLRPQRHRSEAPQARRRGRGAAKPNVRRKPPRSSASRCAGRRSAIPATTRCRRHPPPASCSPRAVLVRSDVQGSGRRGQVLKQDVLAKAANGHPDRRSRQSCLGAARPRAQGQNSNRRPVRPSHPRTKPAKSGCA